MADKFDQKSIFVGSTLSQFYQECRPAYSGGGVMDKILGFMEDSLQAPYERAADIGCGTGLSTQLLVSHFKDIVGVDRSATQLEQARRSNEANNVQFCIGSAEDLSMFDDSSLDLVIVGTAVHFFKMDAFYKELDRVLRPGGTFAQYGYCYRYWSSEVVSLSIDGYQDHPAYAEVSKQCNQLFIEILQTIFSKMGFPESFMDRVKHGADPPSDYIDQRRYTEELTHPCRLPSLIGLFRSYAPWLNDCTEIGTSSEDMARPYEQRFIGILKQIADVPEEILMKQHMGFYITMARKPCIADFPISKQGDRQPMYAITMNQSAKLVCWSEVFDHTMTITN